MKLFGFNRKGFLYIDNGNNLISQQTTSGESQMLDAYCSIQEYDNLDAANIAYNKPKPTSIDRRFREDMINDVVWDMTDI
jgi:hypothetical protein